MVQEEGHWTFAGATEQFCTEEMSERYNMAHPFPHIILPNFLDAPVLDALSSGFPIVTDTGESFSSTQEMLKTQFHPRNATTPQARRILDEFNTDLFLAFLSRLTGIRGLVPDPTYSGGGFHETRSGGKLNIHADFSHHPTTHLQRRINLILFLNQNWKAEYGGHLELWERSMEKCAVSAAPELGTAVIFNTDSDSYHGHPNPLNTPPHVTRRSVALYYYSLPEEVIGIIRRRTTDFKARPGTNDQAVAGFGMRDWLRDLTPPVIWRALKSLNR